MNEMRVTDRSGLAVSLSIGQQVLGWVNPLDELNRKCLETDRNLLFNASDNAVFAALS